MHEPVTVELRSTKWNYFFVYIFVEMIWKLVMKISLHKLESNTTLYLLHMILSESIFRLSSLKNAYISLLDNSIQKVRRIEVTGILIKTEVTGILIKTEVTGFLIRTEVTGILIKTEVMGI